MGPEEQEGTCYIRGTATLAHRTTSTVIIAGRSVRRRPLPRPAATLNLVAAGWHVRDTQSRAMGPNTEGRATDWRSALPTRVAFRVEQHQRCHAQLVSEHIHGVQREVPLPALDPGQVSRRDPKLLGQPLLSQPSGTTEVAHLRTEDRLESIRHSNSVLVGTDDFQVVIASTTVHGMRSDTRRNCPAHGALNPADAATANCTSSMRAALAAIAVRPIPAVAIESAAAAGAAMALRHEARFAEGRSEATPPSLSHGTRRSGHNGTAFGRAASTLQQAGRSQQSGTRTPDRSRPDKTEPPPTTASATSEGSAQTL